MTVSITTTGTTPTVGGDDDVWGGILNSHIDSVKDDLDAIATAINADVSTLTAFTATVTAALAAVQSVKPGTIIAYADTIVPAGYLECNGAAVSRTTYAALYAVIAGTHGGGDGTTTFNLPDLRGEFIRGWDHSRGIDSGRSFATGQGGAIEAHTHSVPGLQNDSPSSGLADGAGSTTVTVNTSSTGGTETRPRNIALMYLIKT